MRARHAGLQVDRANRVESLTGEVEELVKSRDLKFFGALPFSTVLASTRMDEVQASLKAQMEGEQSRTDVTVNNVSAIACCTKFLPSLETRDSPVQPNPSQDMRRKLLCLMEDFSFV